jgi:predicted DNA binding CopG/RHH family protein
MKKIGLIVFIFALSIGLVFSTNCSFGTFSKMSGVQGSGTAKSETRNLSGFTRIDAGGAINIEVAVQKDFSVTVEADDNLLTNIKTEVSGDTLKIYTEDSISTKTRINVVISMPELEGVNVSGASRGVIADVNADSLEIKASGASKIKINGTAKELNAEANGASSIEAESLKVENADVEANGASKAVVSAANELKIAANGASNVSYIGEPKNIEQTSSGASSITKR